MKIWDDLYRMKNFKILMLLVIAGDIKQITLILLFKKILKEMKY